MNRKRRGAVLMGLVLGGMLLLGCQEKNLGDVKPTIGVSIEPLASIVREIAGNEVRVITLIPKGASPETYEASPKQIEAFSRASLVFTLGLPSESGKVIPTASGKVVPLGEAVSREYRDLTFGGVERDHHIWLSPKRVMVMAREIAAALIQMDEETRGNIEYNLASYLRELEALDLEIKELYAQNTKNAFVIFHPSLHYFAEDYGLNMIPLEEEGKEANPTQLKGVILQAKALGIKNILASDEADSKQSQAFATELGGKVIPISVLSGDYVTMIRELAKAVLKGL